MSEKSIFDEKEIIAALKDSNKREYAFTLLIKQHSQALYWQIRRMVFSHDDANDLLQNTFLKAWSNIDKFRGEAQLSTWLHRIAINETLTFLGKNQSNIISIDSPEGDIAHQLESDAHFSGDHADALFQEAIARLPHKQRLVFTLKYYRDMKYEEIAQLTDTSVGALKASYHIAVSKIEKFLQEQN